MACRRQHRRAYIRLVFLVVAILVTGGLKQYGRLSAPHSDGTQPSVNVLSPRNGTRVAGTIIVSASTVGRYGNKGVQFRIDDNLLGAELREGSYSASWDTSAYVDGPHVLRASAQDTEGTQVISSSVTVTVSNAGGEAAAHTTGKWVMGYYAAWQTNLYPVNRIDFTALTHICLVHWMTNSNGTLQTSQMDSIGPEIIRAAHANRVRAIMMLGGSDDLNFAKAASPVNRPALVDAIVKKIDSLHLDGVDLDWEQNIDRANFVALAQILRQARPDLIITVPIDASIRGSGIMAAVLAPYCDQLNMMTYGGGAHYPGWLSWYFSALRGEGSDHPASIDMFVANWLKAGVPAAKIGVGIGFYARGWTAPVTDGLQTIGAATVPIGELPYGASAANGGGVLSWFYNKPGATYTWSGSQMGDKAAAQQPSISIPGGLTPAGWPGAPITWVTFEDDASILAKANYVKSHDLGGTIVWTLNQGATDSTTGRNPQLDAVKLGFLETGPAPTPLVSAATAHAGSGAASTITLTRLSPSLKQVVAVWRGGGSDFDSAASGAQTYGRPSEYYIDASTNGVAWISLVHVTGNTYNTRQFTFDITGQNYTRMRMRVISWLDKNNHKLTVQVNSAPNNAADTYLYLGDSVTTNCWGAAEVDFGELVTAKLPARYPISSNAGTAGQLSSGPLSTTPYDVPQIRKWLTDFPTVKFVGLSYGVNDANENVPAAIYCANVQALVQEVIAAGKTPIVPTIISSPSHNVLVNAPAMNSCLAKLKDRYPSIISGPDLWAVFSGHSITDGWFLDRLHPSLNIGCKALRDAWVGTMTSTIYAHD